MVKFALQIKATLENIEKLQTSSEFSYFLKLKCLSCGEISEKWHGINKTETFPSKTAKSSVNFLAKCKLCSRENTLDIISGSNGEYTADNQNNFKTIVVFECRGIEPVDFSPREGWICVCQDSGKSFDDVDLTEKEWVEYDDVQKNSVGVYDLEWKFTKLK